MCNSWYYIGYYALTAAYGKVVKSVWFMVATLDIIRNINKCLDSKCLDEYLDFLFFSTNLTY